jgi:tetraacyldisaccharide 4'-kinase
LSLLYGALFALRGWFYRLGWLRTERVDVPVIVVGNVIAGGAGKTPVVMAVVRHLQARGLQVGVVSRGYGRRTDDCREVLDDSDPRDVGDEPALIRHATGAPVFVARRRIEAARAAGAPSGDPGHRERRRAAALALARDIEICVFDDRGIGNGWLLPAGHCASPGHAAATWCCTAASGPHSPAATPPPADWHRMR